MRYVWQRSDWAANLHWDRASLLEPLARARSIQGRLIGKTFKLGFDLGLQVQLETIITEAIGTAAIEGETLNAATVRSSVARRLGLEVAAAPPQVRSIDGLVEVLLDATSGYDTALTDERLKGWQAALFPAGFSGTRRILVGEWRHGDEPMQVVSGAYGREKVHFEAPPSSALPDEMRAFFTWWHASHGVEEGVLRAALAHFRFVTIHPFEDGNGRLARALADKALAQDEKTGLRLYSLSSQIMTERKDYYSVLERTQKGTGDLTAWMVWFLGMFERALLGSDKEVERVLAKDRFWRGHGLPSVNERQILMLNRLLDAGPGGFQGGLTTKKYVAMTKTSESTAKREILDLIEQDLIVHRNRIR